MLAVMPSGCRVKEKRRLRWRRASRLWFPGQQHDSATGLNYNYFRDYEPSAGRYVQSDPIGLNGGMSTYSYAESSPLISIDRLGLLSEGGMINSTPESCDICTAARPGGQETMEAVARIVLKRIYVMSRNKNIEICGLICQDSISGRFFSAAPTLGSGTTCAPATNRCPRCSKTRGVWHTHGAPEGNKWDAELMSMGPVNTDQSFTHAGAEYWGYPNFTNFLGTPMGVLRSYTASSGRVISGGPL
jgi:RHS repeat-associated protein